MKFLKWLKRPEQIPLRILAYLILGVILVFSIVIMAENIYGAVPNGY